MTAPGLPEGSGPDRPEDGPPPDQGGDAGRPARTTDARLARVHLRTGALGLARAELETLAGHGALDDDALLDLAEVRWRTGDLTGAGEAARAFLATGREDALGLVIAAEAAAALGRPGEARRLVTRAVERTDRPLEAVFAGIARSPVWPTDADRGEQAAVLFPAAGPAHAGRDRGAGARREGPDTAPWRAASGTTAAIVAVGRVEAPDDAETQERGPGGPVPGIDAAIAEPGLWDDDPAAAEVDPSPDPDAELADARVALARDDPEAAALHLALALRLDPTLALAVLDAAGRHPGPGLDVVRGDALRVAGRDADARASYASAARGLRGRAGAYDRNGRPDASASPIVHPEEDS